MCINRNALYILKSQSKPTVWNLNAINGRTKSNQAVIFFPTNSGKITSNEFPMLRTTISDLITQKEEEKSHAQIDRKIRLDTKKVHLGKITQFIIEFFFQHERPNEQMQEKRMENPLLLTRIQYKMGIFRRERMH